jgi:molybdopterin molybdotransferase
VPDTAEATRRAFADAIADADVVVSTGGVSVGPRDHVKPALRALGVDELFWRIATQPGQPVWCGIAPRGTLVAGLPGNPLITFSSQSLCNTLTLWKFVRDSNPF